MPQAFQYDVIEKAYKEVRYKAVITQWQKLLSKGFYEFSQQEWNLHVCLAQNAGAGLYT